MRIHRKRSGRPPSGFTLLEVLVALVIVGTALVTSVRAVGSLAENNGAMRAITYATWSAENRFVNIRVSGEWPEPGKRIFDCSQDNVAMICEEEVTAASNPNFRRVQISVYDARDRSRRIVKLAQAVPNAL